MQLLSLEATYTFSHNQSARANGDSAQPLQRYGCSDAINIA
jgi:hypothetical protein